MISMIAIVAESQQQPDLSQESLEDLMKIQVYTASRRMQLAGEAPAPVTIISASEIRNHGYRSLADLLRNVRSFYLTYDQDYFYVGVRGFLRPGDYNTHVLVMVDGHRINDDIYYQAPVGNEFPLDMDMIERVEIVRGPSSSLYGTNAYWGVINVITRKAPDLEGWEFSFAPASFGSYTGRASYGARIKDMDVLLSGTFSDAAGHRLFVPSFNSPETNFGIAPNADYESFHDLLAIIHVGNFTWQGVSGIRDKGISTGAYGTQFNDPRTHNVDGHQYMDLSYKRPIGNRWDVMAKVFYDRYTYDGNWAYAANLSNTDYVRGQSWGSEIQWNWRWTSRNTVTFGSEVRNDFQQDQKNYDLNPYFLYLDDRRSSWMGAGYLQDELRIGTKWILNAGFRYDRYSEWRGSLNPRLAVMYKPFASSSVKLLYGSAFRIPNVYEAHYGASGNTNYEINPSLKPESTRNIEVVWEQDLRNSIRLSTGVFHSIGNGLITLTTDSTNGLFIFRNETTSHATGAELELAGRLGRWLEGRTSYTYTQAQQSGSEGRLSNSPAHLAKLNITETLWKGRLIAGFDGQYESSRTTISGDRLGGFPVFNLTISSGKSFNRLELSGSIYNFMDRAYFLPVGDEVPSQRVQQAGRTARIKLTVHF